MDSDVSFELTNNSSGASASDQPQKKSSAEHSRVLLKVSGEMLTQRTILTALLDQIKALQGQTAFAVVTGGGNIFRGRSSPFQHVKPALTDGIGMCASLLNALFLHAEMTDAGLPASVFAPFAVPGVCPAFDAEAAMNGLTEGKTVILGGGTGMPFVTTDTAAVWAALRTECQMVLKGTKVDGVFDKDPQIHPSATFLPKLTYSEVLKRGLTPMDKTAMAMAQENNMPIRVFSLEHTGCLVQTLKGTGHFTEVAGEYRGEN